MGNLRRDPFVRLQSRLLVHLDQNNSSVLIIATEVRVAHDAYFSVIYSGNYTLMLVLEQLLQEVRFHRLSF